MTNVHETAFLAPGSEVDPSVVVGPFCYVGGQVRIGKGSRLGPHVTIQGRTTIGEDNHFVGQCGIGGPPQDLKYAGEESALVIGDRNIIREFVTVNIGTAKGAWITSIGSDNLLMACSHVAHDCSIEDEVVMGNNVLLAGHVRVESQSIISGGAAVNHFVTVGTLSMVGGMARVMQDVPPFMIFEGSPGRVRGVNTVGLNRRGMDPDAIRQLRDAYRRLFADEYPKMLAIQELEAEGNLASETTRLLTFLRDMERGYQGRYRESLRRTEAGGEAS